MARSRSDFYNTIEYIGPRPQKPKPRNFSGGWVIIVIALSVGSWFARPLIPFLKAAGTEASTEQADLLISSLKTSKGFGRGLAAAALEGSHTNVTYDPAYYKIGYPNGDLPASKGVAADVIIRAFRGMDMDLQVLVHEDMAKNFRSYPGLWGATAPDTNIDHRRVANLQRFFERNAETISPSHSASDYQPGDIVVWELGNAEKHIGIIVPGPGDRAGEAWVVHNIGAGVKWENILFDYKPLGHFRFPSSVVK